MRSVNDSGHHSSCEAPEHPRPSLHVWTLVQMVAPSVVWVCQSQEQATWIALGAAWDGVGKRGCVRSSLESAAGGAAGCRLARRAASGCAPGPCRPSRSYRRVSRGSPAVALLTHVCPPSLSCLHPETFLQNYPALSNRDPNFLLSSALQH